MGLQSNEDEHIARLQRSRADRSDTGVRCAIDDIVLLERDCVFGDPASDVVVLVVGDSHAMQWLPALDVAARSLGLRILFSGKSACPSVPVVVMQKTRVPFDACTSWQRSLPSLMARVRPAAIVAANAEIYVTERRLVGASDPHRVWADGVARLRRDAESAGAPLGLILDAPRLDLDPIDCLALHVDSPGVCAPSQIALARLTAVHEAERLGGAQYFNPLDRLCPAGTCTMVDDVGASKYRDTNHITPTAAREFAPDLQRFLRSLVIR